MLTGLGEDLDGDVVRDVVALDELADEVVIRVNSQSGKGGVAYLLKSEHNLDLPRRAQIEFSHVIQDLADAQGGEVSGADLWRVFQDEYLPAEDKEKAWGRYRVRSLNSESGEDGAFRMTAEILVDGELQTRTAAGNGPIDAFLKILGEDGQDVRVLDYTEHALSEGGSAMAAAYVEAAVGDRVLWGVGLDHNTTTASLKALISAVNRALRD